MAECNLLGAAASCDISTNLQNAGKKPLNAKTNESTTKGQKKYKLNPDTNEHDNSANKSNVKPVT